VPAMFVLGFPLLLIPFAIYNIAAFILGMPDEFWTRAATTVPMMTGQPWVVTWEDALLALTIFLLWIEVIKSTRINVRAVIDHVLALLLFVVMLVEFLLVAKAGTSTFFLVMFICLIDVLAGFIVGIRSSQRQVEIEGTGKV
jgi:hypothetical protein